MKTGIELIADERREQIEKHGRTINDDVNYNNRRQLASGAKRILEIHPDPLNLPGDWDAAIWARMCAKPYLKRLVISGALIAAEIDRINHLIEQEDKLNNTVAFSGLICDSDDNLDRVTVKE